MGLPFDRELMLLVFQYIDRDHDGFLKKEDFVVFC